jgi:uncharacterized membrane protein YqgA involved in biofilm formation
MGLPNDFYTISSLFTLSGSSMAIWIITSVLGDLFKRRIKKETKKWIALALSFVFSLLGATLLTDRNLLVWVVAIVNGFFIYFTAIGLNTLTSQESTRRASSIRKTSADENMNSFFESWW